VRKATSVLGTAAIILAALALSACGGGSSDSGSSSVQDTAYGKQLTKVCKQAQQRTAQLPQFPFPTFNALSPDASQLPAVGKFFERGSLPALEKFEAEVKSVKPSVKPSAAEKQSYKNFVRDLDAMIASVKRQIAAAGSSDVKAFVGTVHEADKLTAQLQAAEAALQIPACTNIG
jgi:hypothetical protein